MSDGRLSRVLLYSLQNGRCFYAPVPDFWNNIDSLQLLGVPSPPWLTYYSGVLLVNDDGNSQLAQGTVALEIVMLTLGAILRTVCHGSITQNQ